jgi:hypothetical protein
MAGGVAHCLPRMIPSNLLSFNILRRFPKIGDLTEASFAGNPVNCRTTEVPDYQQPTRFPLYGSRSQPRQSNAITQSKGRLQQPASSLEGSPRFLAPKETATMFLINELEPRTNPLRNQIDQPARRHSQNHYALQLALTSESRVTQTNPLSSSTHKSDQKVNPSMGPLERLAACYIRRCGHLLCHRALIPRPNLRPTDRKSLIG